MNDYRPAYVVSINGKPRRLVVKDAIDSLRFILAKNTGTLLARSHIKGVLVSDRQA